MDFRIGTVYNQSVRGSGLVSYKSCVAGTDMTNRASAPMAKKRPGKDPVSPDEKTTVKMRSELVRRARTVAAYRDIDLFEYLDQLVGPMVDRDYQAIVKAEGGGK